MSRSLVKIVDNSLLPAAMMIIGKFIGVVLVIKIFDLPWSMKEYTSNIFSFSTLVRTEDVELVTSYSDLVMIVFLSIGLTVTIFRAIYFHSSHIKPTLVTKLANKNLLNLIQSSYEIYHAAAVWILFNWIGTILILTNIINGKTFDWIGIVSIVTSILLTVVLLQDVYKEVENIKHNPGEYNWK